jgi:probable F420-dependent oxidoreductase
MFPTDYAIRPDEVAREAEQRGFESIFFPEHTHIPTSRRTPFPRGGDLPAEYYHTIDPFVALTMAAAATRNLKLATGICLVIERDPIVLAKEVASVDLASNGRFIFGIGGGWNSEEMENHGTNFKTRWQRLRESIEAMKAIWTNDEASYHGELIRFEPPGAGPNLFRSHTHQFCSAVTVLVRCSAWCAIAMAGSQIADVAATCRRRLPNCGDARSRQGATRKASRLQRSQRRWIRVRSNRTRRPEWSARCSSCRPRRATRFCQFSTAVPK